MWAGSADSKQALGALHYSRLAGYLVLLRNSSTLGNCSCIALDRCSRRGSTSSIPGVVPFASMQSSYVARHSCRGFTRSPPLVTPVKAGVQ